MSSDCECIGENDSAADAAKKLKDLGVGAMPICGEDDRLKGVVSDRDIVVNVVAEGRDPSDVKVGELGDGEPVTIGADDPISEAIKTMADKQVRRLPVIDGHELVGIVSLADIAKSADQEEVGELVAALSSGSDNSG
jgi:CBS domain-containing protein